jgi:hypothetical protein
MFSFNFFAAQRAYVRKGEVAAAPLDGPVETCVSAVISHLFFCYQQSLQSYLFFCKLQKKKENRPYSIEEMMFYDDLFDGD